MTALVIDSDCLLVVHSLVTAGRTEPALRALGLLIDGSPQRHGDATRNQTWLLRLLTGADVRPRTYRIPMPRA